MARFRFNLIGASQTPVLEVEVSDLHVLAEMMTRSRFVHGKLVEIDGQGASCDILVAVSRVQFVSECN
jgi:hypothetical protein